MDTQVITIHPGLILAFLLVAAIGLLFGPIIRGIWLTLCSFPMIIVAWVLIWPTLIGAAAAVAVEVVILYFIWCDSIKEVQTN